MRKGLALIAVLVVAGAGLAFAMGERADEAKTYSWRYKITVTVETPEGDVSGTAVREMGNAPPSSMNPERGNPAKVRGEAVVADLGARGVLFALISHDSDNRFYDAFPLPGREDGQGGSTEAGMKYHASLPVGTTGTLDPTEPPGYPKLVTFTNPKDPQSVTLVQVWERQQNGRFVLKEDRFTELFGPGVRLKDITLEITDAPVTWGRVDEFLPKPLLSNFEEWWDTLSNQEKMSISNLLQFKQGEPK